MVRVLMECAGICGRRFCFLPQFRRYRQDDGEDFLTALHFYRLILSRRKHFQGGGLVAPVGPFPISSHFSDFRYGGYGFLREALFFLSISFTFLLLTWWRRHGVGEWWLYGGEGHCHVRFMP